MTSDILRFKLGLKPLTPDSRDLLFANYRTSLSISVPPNYGSYGLIPRGTWGILGNAVYGNCFPAGQGHAEKIFTAEGSGTPINITVNNALADYFAMNGVAPGAPESPSDQGTDPRAGLQYHQQIGMIDASGQRHKLGAYAALQVGSLTELDEATYLTGATGIGINCPRSAQDQFPSGHWTVVPGSPDEGGHWIICVGRWNGWYECISWGKRVHVAPDFLTTYTMCAFSLLSPEVIRSGSKTAPDGLSYTALAADVAAVTA